MTPEQMRDASLLELFSLEAEAQTQVLSAGLLALERDPTQADHLESCMRAAHSLKGAARIVGIDSGVSVAHVMEDCLVSAQESRLYLQPEHIDALLQGTDLLMRIATPGNDVGPADIEAYVAGAKAELAQAVPMPEGYRIEYGGQFRWQQDRRPPGHRLGLQRRRGSACCQHRNGTAQHQPGEISQSHS